MANPKGTTRRAGAGTRFEATVESVDLERRVAELRQSGMSWRRVADAAGVSLAGAYEAWQRGLNRVPYEAVMEARRLECERLDADLEETYRLDGIAEEVLRREHLVVSDGRVIKDGNRKLLDPKPVLDAVASHRANIETRRKITETRAKLCGLNAPTQTEVVVRDTTDAAIERLAAELAAMGPADQAAVSGPTAG